MPQRTKSSRSKPCPSAGRGPMRDPEYRRFIRTLPCSVGGCNKIYIQAAHYRVNGMGSKSSDYTCVPLCQWHHLDGPYALHKGLEAFEAEYGISIPAIIADCLGLWGHQVAPPQAHWASLYRLGDLVREGATGRTGRISVRCGDVLVIAFDDGGYTLMDPALVFLDFYRPGGG